VMVAAGLRPADSRGRLSPHRTFLLSFLSTSFLVHLQEFHTYWRAYIKHVACGSQPASLAVDTKNYDAVRLLILCEQKCACGVDLEAARDFALSRSVVNLRQGALEASNVQPVIEISHMIEVMRAYEATANLSKSQEDMMRQAIERLGQTPN